jgi:DNA-binding NtrC family response regulator
MKKLSGKTILIVDDEAEIRTILREVFESQGCRVLEAASGNGAFRLIKAHNIDVVISDIRMSDGNGLDLLRNIKAHHPDRPIVFLITGFSAIEDEYNVSGAAGIFQKPFDLDDIVSKVADVLLT